MGSLDRARPVDDPLPGALLPPHRRRARLTNCPPAVRLRQFVRREGRPAHSVEHHRQPGDPGAPGLGPPIGLLPCGILPYVRDEDRPAQIVADLAAALPSGSYVFIHHLPDTGGPAAAELQARMSKGPGQVRCRTPGEVRRLFGDLPPAEPGRVPVPERRPDPGAPLRADYGVMLFVACAGVARKP
ncbi:MAG TPA: SAM-dependent methyltransferase [Trebonia sp.]|nr:SAM-dependent methyltransferase [Trebonia sp.]